MKRFLIFAATCAFALTVFQSGGADVSVNFFYDNLNGGNWYQVADYGYVWQPDAATSPDWRPYTDGYWTYTDVGWTWVSYEDFGWATYHYGRWVRLEDYGWCWVPGYEWGPAWVSWRTGGNYVGWAPLPPEGRSEIVYESRPITGHVDVEFGIGPAYYNFIDVRFIGEPVLRGHFYDYNQNVTYINNTVNVTNITYNNSIVYNYGPDYAVLSRYSTRPIPRLKLERTNVDPLQAVKAGNITKVQGDKLVLGAPLKLQKANTQIAPKVVKAKIDQPKIEKGWANISDPNTKARLEQKFKTENSQNVPKPTLQPNAGANVNALASPGVPAVEKGKGKQKGGKFENQVGASAAPGTTPFEQGHGKKGKGQKLEAEQGTSISTPPAESMEQGKGKKGKGQRAENEAGTSAGPSPVGSFEPGKGKHNGQRFENEPGAPVSQGSSGSFEQGKAKKKGQGEQGEQTPGPGRPVTPQNPNANLANPSSPEGGKHKGNRHEETYQPGSQNVGGGAGGGGKRHEQQFQPQGQPQRQGGQSGQQGGPGGQQAGGGGGKHREQIQSQGPPQGGQHGSQGGQQGGGQGKGKGKKGEPSPTPSPR
jgi:hypothetical protein